MNLEPYILALSSDFERFEAALVDVRGRIAHVERRPVRIASVGSGGVHIDPGHFLSTAFATVRALVQRKPREARRVQAVGIIGRSPSVTLVDASGSRTPFLLAEDEKVRRARESLSAPSDEIRRRVGLASGSLEIPSCMRASAGGTGGGTGKFLTPKDFLKWAMTGECSTDLLDAQKTFLFDLEKRAWSSELGELFGIDMSLLPDILPSEAASGELRGEVAAAMGVKSGLPVSCGMGDWGEYLGSGVWETGDAFEHIGTTGAFYGVLDARPPVETDLEVRPHVREGLYLAGRELLPGGTVLEWLLAKSYLARNGVIDWPAVEDELEAIAAMGSPENVMFFPRLTDGEGQVLKAAFINLLIEDNLTSLIQGLIEGLFFELELVAEELRKLPWRLRAVHTTGQVGFKHAPRRIRAHIYGVRVHAGRTPGANLYSAALVGAVAGGLYPSLEEAREGMLDIDGGTVPDEKIQALYDEHFARWLATRKLLFEPSPS